MFSVLTLSAIKLIFQTSLKKLTISCYFFYANTRQYNDSLFSITFAKSLYRKFSLTKNIAFPLYLFYMLYPEYSFRRAKSATSYRWFSFSSLMSWQYLKKGLIVLCKSLLGSHK